MNKRQEAKLLKLQESLPLISVYDGKADKYVVTKVRSFAHNGVVEVSAEEGDGAAEYYGLLGDGISYIHPELEKWAEKNHGHWEWRDPGSICFYRD